MADAGSPAHACHNENGGCHPLRITTAGLPGTAYVTTSGTGCRVGTRCGGPCRSATPVRFSATGCHTRRLSATRLNRHCGLPGTTCETTSGTAAAWGLGAAAQALPRLPRGEVKFGGLRRVSGCRTRNAEQHTQGHRLPHVAGLVAASHGDLWRGRCVSWGKRGMGPKTGGKGGGGLGLEQLYLKIRTNPLAKRSNIRPL